MWNVLERSSASAIGVKRVGLNAFCRESIEFLKFSRRLVRVSMMPTWEPRQPRQPGRPGPCIWKSRPTGDTSASNRYRFRSRRAWQRFLQIPNTIQITYGRLHNTGSSAAPHPVLHKVLGGSPRGVMLPYVTNTRGFVRLSGSSAVEFLVCHSELGNECAIGRQPPHAFVQSLEQHWSGPANIC